MKLFRYRFLALAISAVCAAPYAAADLKAQCLLGVPQFHGEMVDTDPAWLPIQIESDQAVVNQPQNAVFSGNVQMQHGHRQLNAEQIRVVQNSETDRTAYLEGRFNYADNLIQLDGEDAEMHIDAQQGSLARADYQFVGRQGRGTAENIELNPQTRRLKNATFTACLPDDNAWSVEAKEMVQHVEQEYAELWHARFKVMGVPVFYSPYLQFPIGDRRRSGLLLPQKVGHSDRDGYSYGQPFYWNIAPNMDATLTPVYYSKRGWQLNPEFRYLTGLGEGIVAGEYLNRDRLPEWTDKDKSRYMLYWKHYAGFLNYWRLSVDYTQVSDRRYFSDFDSDYGNSTDGYATQQFRLGYYQPNYNLSLSGKKFQTFDDLGIKPYRTFPQIDFNYYRNNLVKQGDFKLFAQAAYFDNDSKVMPTAWRFHLEPSLVFPWANRYGSLELETKLYATQYAQRNGKGENAEIVDHSVGRLLPQIKLDFKTVLESGTQLFSGYTQTFSPRAQYLYRPFKDQSNIGSAQHQHLGLGYDSALLLQDYYSLFNDRRYSGLDRIASANQITIGGTTHFFNDETGQEVFNFSAGQTYYLSPSRIDHTSANSTTGRSSSWSLESNWKFHPQWNWHGSYQYDTRLDETMLANMSLQFKPAEDKVIQANYRYASQNYIDQNLQSGSNRYSQDIKQIGGVVGWAVNDNIALMLSHYRDVALKKPVETQFAMNYNTCCWTATLYTARRLTNTPAGASDTINDFYYDNRFGINFELRGLGGSYNNGVKRMLRRGNIPYTEGFNIN